MRKLIITCMLLTLTACGTVGGAVTGLGEDLGRVGNVIRGR